MIRRTAPQLGAAAAAALCLLAGVTANAAVVPGRIVLGEDDETPAAVSPVQDVFSPQVNGAGQIAFAGRFDSGLAFIWIDDEVVWLPTDEAASVVPAFAPDLGTTAADDFVVQSVIDGTFGLWTPAGALVLDEQPTDLFPVAPNATLQFFLDTKMTSGGDIYFRGTVDDGGGGSADLSGLFRSTDGVTLELLVGSGDTVDGVALAADETAFNRAFDISDQGTHFIANLSADSGIEDNGLVVVDAAIVVREGDEIPNTKGELWRQFELLSINESGDYLFNGTTSEANAEFVGYDAEVQLREGDMLDGRPLDFDVRFMSINDNGNALIGWAFNDGGTVQEAVLFACDASDLAGTAQVLVEVDDTLDIDADGVGDWTVADIVGSTSDPYHGLGDGVVYLEVDLDPGDIDTIVEIPASCCGNGAVNGGEDCDDGDDDDTDDCPSTCLQATCGDGFVWAGNEECDDGNDVDDDDCANDCTVPLPGSESSSSSGSDPSSSSSTGSGPDGSTGRASSGEDTTGNSSGAADSSGSDPDTGGAVTTGPDQTDSGETPPPEGDESGREPDTDTDADADAVADDSGCGCTSGGGSWSPLMLLLVAGLGRRRRAGAHR